MAITTINIGGRDVKVDTSIADRLRAANDAMISATGTPIKINESLRSSERQAELFARSQAGEIGRAAPPGTSFHETGMAIDVGNPDEAQQFLNRFGLRNDLDGDRGHFSFGETKQEKYQSFADSVEKGRQRGFTDTELVDVFAKKNPEQAKAIETARQRYSVDGNIKNDRDLVNFLALRYSGVGRLSTPSVAEEKVQEVKEKPGFLARAGQAIVQRGKDIAQTFRETARGDITPVETGIRTVGDVIGGFGDVLGDALVSGIKLIPGTEKAGEAFLNTEFGQGALKKLSEGMDSYNEWKSESETNRRIGETVEGLINISEVVPISTGARIGARGAAKITPEVAEIASKAGKEVAEKGKAITQFGVTQATGLAPETIERIIKNPEKFTKEAIDAVDRDSLAKDVIGKIEARLDALKDTGKGYTAIRASGATVDLDPNFFESVLKDKYNLDLIDGKVTPTRKSITRKQTDISAIQNIIDDWGDAGTIGADEFLNLRDDLTELSKFDATRSSASQKVGRGIRDELNSKYRKDIDGLKELDNLYASETKVLKEVKKDFFKKDGTLKDNAISKIANITGKGKEQALDRIRNLVPDIDEQVRVLKAIENIEAARGIQVGAYAKSLAGGTAIIGALTGNPALILTAILANPVIIIPLLRAYGKIRKIKGDVIDKMSNKIKDGKELNTKEKAIVSDMLDDDSKELVDEVKKLKK